MANCYFARHRLDEDLAGEGDWCQNALLARQRVFQNSGRFFEPKIETALLFGPSDPRVLPRHLEILVVSAEATVGASAVSDLDRLVLLEWQ